MCSSDLPRQMGFPLDISFHRALWWVGCTVSEPSKNPYGYKKPQNPSEKALKLKCPHAESDSDNDSDQTLFPIFILMESTEDTPNHKVVSLHYRKKSLAVL